MRKPFGTHHVLLGKPRVDLQSGLHVLGVDAEEVAETHVDGASTACGEAALGFIAARALPVAVPALHGPRAALGVLSHGIADLPLGARQREQALL